MADEDETLCCDDPRLWVANEISSGSCHARLERCATCEDHRVTSWWYPPPGGWVGAMGLHSAKLREQVVVEAYLPQPDDAVSDRA